MPAGGKALEARWVSGNHILIKDKSGLSSITADDDYLLLCDIDLQGIEWTPIGDDINPFKGTFNGGGFKIYNFTVNGSFKYAALFGYNKGTIKNLSVEDFIVSSNSLENAFAGGLVGFNDYHGTVKNCFSNGNIAAASEKAYVGGLAGQNVGIVINSYATGNVNAVGVSYAYAGGLVGNNDRGVIVNSYATGGVKSDCNGSAGAYAYAGGLAGHNSYTIDNSFAIGNVSAVSPSKADIGGLVGKSIGIITNCYRYSGQTFSRKVGLENYGTASNTQGTKASLNELQSADFSFTKLQWTEVDLWNYENDKFPTLSYAYIKQTEDTPISLSNAAQLNALAGKVLTLSYSLSKDIALGNENWEPIKFYGSFDGNDYRIYNFSFNTNTKYINIGLFSKNYGEIKNLGLFSKNYGEIKNLGVNCNIDVTINGHYEINIGGLAAFNMGTITNCYTTGEIKILADDNFLDNINAGGLVGYNGDAVIENCYTAGNIRASTAEYKLGTVRLGGLVGLAYKSIIINCYTTGSAIKNDSIEDTHISDLVGLSYDSIITNS